MNDARTLEQFALSWRWTSADHAVLPKPVLESIYPLSSDEARAISQEALRRWRPNETTLEFPADESAAATPEPVNNFETASGA